MKKRIQGESKEQLFLHAGKEPEVLDLPPSQYLAIEGCGNPEAAAFQVAIGALYSVAYTIKFTLKKAGKPDFKVSPLEAIWSVGTAKTVTADMWKAPRAEWRWKALIRMPESVKKADVEAAKRAVIAKRGEGSVPRVLLERIAEGKVIHILHVGPYATEPESVAKMQALMKGDRLVPRGLHHEIYLGDPRRAKPEKLKTILRQPVAAA